MRAEHGVRAKHCEQHSRHEQREHAHAAQVDGSAYRRRPRLRAGRWVGAPAPTSRIGGSHSRGRPAQAATSDQVGVSRVWVQRIPLGRRRPGGRVAARGCADGACDLGQAACTDGKHANHQVPQRGKRSRRAPAMQLSDAHWSLSSAAKVRPVRVRRGEGRARLGGAWLARAGPSSCVRPDGQRVGLARIDLRRHRSGAQGRALQPLVQ
jgi:hypothetical protein